MRNFRTAAVAAATAVAVAFSGTAIASAADAGSSEAKTNQSSTENKQSSNENKQSSNDNQATGSAKTEGEQSSKPNAQSSTGNGGTTLSSKIGADTDAHDLNKGGKGYVTGTDLSSNNPDNGKWVNIWSGGTYALVGTAIAGALIALYNYAVYTGLLPNHILDSIFR
ncbi:hypothetical protein [Corynebacterium lizhenjunii]|uniref:hypothetical protein n=1 Tax=Corynebacterium lizhenjunii TaxID=2709394 RepID=UPI0013EDDA90|nr:hypothetical protein [Corynebacterium lizhenjunii]